eukprot:479474-Rhodomonas_salina.4
MQALLAERRELSEKLQSVEEGKKTVEETLEQIKEAHKREKEEFVEVHRKEMLEMKDAFLNEWMETLSKQSPDVIEKIKGGVDSLINNGLKKDRMWELFCCASKAHKQNVNTIEELQKANNMLSDKNKELEDRMLVSSGFSVEDTRLAKRTRHTDDMAAVPPVGAAAAPAQEMVAETDVWGQFESMMHQSTSRQGF